MEIVDDRGVRIELSREPERIVSLVPSDTYSLAAVGGPERIVGRTAYCVEPAAVSGAAEVGGTKNADVEAIADLAPDLVVANQEESRRVDVERLEAAGLKVLVSFPKTVLDGLRHLERLAELFPSRASDNAPRLSEARRRHDALARREAPPVPTFVPIWMDPLMTIHGTTFISDAIELAGGRNVFNDRRRRYPLGADLGRREPVPAPGRDERYPRITRGELIARRPSLILLPDEPHAFDERDAEFFRELPLEAEVRFCVGKDLMWYGLRALEGLERIAAMMEP